MSRALLMIAAHAVCDYPLQGDFLAKAKNRTAPLPGVPWWQALGAHAIIHGAAVGIITRSPTLGLAEAALHALTDDLKCRGKLTYNQDQAVHLVCKLLWAALSEQEGKPASKGEDEAFREWFEDVGHTYKNDTLNVFRAGFRAALSEQEGR